MGRCRLLLGWFDRDLGVRQSDMAVALGIALGGWELWAVEIGDRCHGGSNPLPFSRLVIQHAVWCHRWDRHGAMGVQSIS